MALSYLPLPVERIELGRPLPINLWDSRGQLLLGRGQPITSEEHRQKLAAHGACATEADFRAWQNAYDRLIYKLLREGVDAQTIDKVPMPSIILSVDYADGYEIKGGWLDLQDVLSGLLYRGDDIRNPLDRIRSIQHKATELLQRDADASLFELFQALADPTLGYCASHALLCAVIADLTARRVGLPELERPVLLLAALMMNVGMARQQDLLARQIVEPSAEQRWLIARHPQASADLLQDYGYVDEDLLDLVAWHHETDPSRGLARNLEARRILRLTDAFVARIAARATRRGQSALQAAKASIMAQSPDDARIGSAITTSVGFYPPGSYVTLANGETAVVLRRGTGPRTPWVACILGTNGLALMPYPVHDTSEPAFAVASPVNPARIRLKLSPDKVQRALAKISVRPL